MVGEAEQSFFGIVFSKQFMVGKNKRNMLKPRIFCSFCVAIALLL